MWTGFVLSRFWLCIGLLYPLLGQADYRFPPGYEHAGQALGLPAQQIYSAALVQSGTVLDNGCKLPWPWTVTVHGHTRHYPSRAEAHGALIKALEAGQPDIRVGLLQVPVQHFTGPIEVWLEPSVNLLTGSRQLMLVSAKTHRLNMHKPAKTLTGLCTPQRQTNRPGSSPGRDAIVALVDRLAPEFTVDPALVKAVIEQESAFNPRAVSPKAAKGLMQLIPVTAARFGVRSPFDPEDNLRGGMAYLHWLLRKFQGDVALTLAAYNAGENAVERHQGIPPYPETRLYVQRILAAYPHSQHPIPPPLGDRDEKA